MGACPSRRLRRTVRFSRASRSCAPDGPASGSLAKCSPPRRRRLTGPTSVGRCEAWRDSPRHAATRRGRAPPAAVDPSVPEQRRGVARGGSPRGAHDGVAAYPRRGGPRRRGQRSAAPPVRDRQLWLRPRTCSTPASSVHVGRATGARAGRGGRRAPGTRGSTWPIGSRPSCGSHRPCWSGCVDHPHRCSTRSWTTRRGGEPGRLRPDEAGALARPTSPTLGPAAPRWVSGCPPPSA